MTDRLPRDFGVLSRSTLIPIGLMLGVLTGVTTVTWWAATDRQEVIAHLNMHSDALNRHDRELDIIRQEMKYQTDALRRLEYKLGTLPISPKNP